jgi:integrase
MERKLPNYCEHKASGRAFVYLPLGPGKRKRVYLGDYNSAASLAKYDKVIGEWLTTKQAPRVADTGPTVRDIAERYQSHREPSLTPDKVYDLRNAVKLLIEMFGSRPATEFHALQFERFRTILIDRGYAREYGNRFLRIVKECCKWAMQRQYMTADQFAVVDSISPLTSKEAPTKVVGPVDDADVEAVLPHLSTDFQETVRFIRATGCRPGEAIRMRVGDVDRESWLLKPASHKTAHKGKARAIPIPSAVHGLLLPRLLRPDDAYVFGAEGGAKPYQKRALGRAIDRVVKRLNVEREEAEEPLINHWHPYQLRHARATEVREQYGVEVAQVILGHARIDMTQHYAKVTEAKAKEVGKLLG